jgi:hypothetical protein
MNKTKTFLMTALAFIVAGTTFTSCDSDDDDYQQLTREQWLSCYSMVGGIHSNKVVIPQETLKDGTLRNDTVDVTWEMKSDSTITISNFPLSKLGGFLNDANLKAAVQTAPNKDVICRYDFYSTNNSQYPVYWVIYPQEADVTLTYEDGTGGASAHKLSFIFHWHPNYSFGQYNSQSKQIEMQLIFAGISVDDGTYANSLGSSIWGIPINFVN